MSPLIYYLDFLTDEHGREIERFNQLVETRLIALRNLKDNEKDFADLINKTCDIVNKMKSKAPH